MKETIQELLLQHEIQMKGEISFVKKIVVPVSGGKDSQSCLKLAIESFPPNEILALFCDTGFEHPYTYQHIENVCSGYGVNLVTFSAGTVESICLKNKRLPGGGSRHCTDALKIRPSKYFYKYLAQIQNQGYEVWYGMRSDESKERELRYRGKTDDTIYLPNDVMKNYPKYLGKMGVRFKLPVIDWSTREVLNFLEGKENILYKFGFDRVGCFPCLAGGEAMQMKAFGRDDTGRKHFLIANGIAEKIGRELFSTDIAKGFNPMCSICTM